MVETTDYQLFNFYWDVLDTNHGTHVWSTASSSFVPVNNATYLAWLARGYSPGVIPTYAALLLLLNAAQVDGDQPGYVLSTTSSPGDVQLTNPMPTITWKVINSAGVALKLPPMNEVNAPPKGKVLYFVNDGASSSSFDIKDNAGTLLESNVRAGALVAFTVDSKATAAGVLARVFRLSVAGQSGDISDLINVNNTVANNWLTDMAEGTFKGRAVGAGTGDPTDLSHGLLFPAGLIKRLQLANNVSDATNDIDVERGICADVNDTVLMALTSGITKRLDAAWAVGTGNGGLDQGTIANATYHVHLIKRLDTGVVDAIFSLSHDESNEVTMTIASPAVVTWNKRGTGHGLVAGSPFKFSTTGALPTGVTAGTQYYVIATGITATTFQFSTTNGGSAVNTSGSQSGTHTGIPGPQMPTSYDRFRRIGSIVRTGGSIKAFFQDGDVFQWAVPVLDVNATNPGTAAVTRTLTLPTGIRVRARGSVTASGVNAQTPGAVYLSDLITTDTAAAAATAQSISSYVDTVTNLNNGGFFEVVANRSAQIRSRIQISDAGVTIFIQTHSWVDARGRVG